MRAGSIPVVSFILVSLGSLGSFGCGGPTGLLPGGALSGESSEAPRDWAFAGNAGTIQLETNPLEPYSVNLAYTILDGRLYINAGGTETQWAKNIATNPEVRLRMDGRVYPLHANRILDAATLEAFAEAWTNQSFFRRDPRNYDEVWLFELVAR